MLTINEDSIQLVQLDVVTWDMYTDALHGYLAIGNSTIESDATSERTR